MKIGLLSDTHSYIDDHILELLNDSDEIWHAGDVGDYSVIQALQNIATVRGVSGNIDSAEIRMEFPEDNVFVANGLKVAITHIGGYPGRYSKHGRALIEEVNPDIFITGHSHILRVIPDKKYNLLHLNPGAAGRSGFHTVRTLLRFEIINGKPANMEAVELGNRGK